MHVDSPPPTPPASGARGVVVVVGRGGRSLVSHREAGRRDILAAALGRWPDARWGARRREEQPALRRTQRERLREARARNPHEDLKRTHLCVVMGLRLPAQAGLGLAKSRHLVPQHATREKAEPLSPRLLSVFFGGWFNLFVYQSP